jgi:CDGSH-type Zn-finger protein
LRRGRSPAKLKPVRRDRRKEVGMSKSGQLPRVMVTTNGPYIVEGAVPVARQTIGVDAEGQSHAWIESDPIAVKDRYALCRCGLSRNKPFCDGSHVAAKFDGTETASRKPYSEQAEVLDGPVLQLRDVETLCAFGRFCDPNGRVWNQVAQTDDPSMRETFVRQVGECPAGRLVAWDKATGRALEPELPVSIGLVEDPAQGCSGPLWLRGGIPVVSADGFAYEVRNRVTLCRCGASQNKPFCDATHSSMKFQD